MLAKSLLAGRKHNDLSPGHVFAFCVKHGRLILFPIIKKRPFHRSFTPIEDVFSIVSFTPSPQFQAADCQRDVVKGAL